MALLQVLYVGVPGRVRSPQYSAHAINREIIKPSGLPPWLACVLSPYGVLFYFLQSKFFWDGEMATSRGWRDSYGVAV